MTCELCDKMMERLAAALAAKRAAEVERDRVIRGRAQLERRITRLRHQLEAQKEKGR